MNVFRSDGVVWSTNRMNIIPKWCSKVNVIG